MAVDQRVHVPKTAELVANQIRRQIVRGELEEGHSLPAEAELMERFGVSRPTLREAFRILESEALITIRRGSRGGAQVLAPSSDVAARLAGSVLQFRRTTVGDVYAARLLIEPPAAAMLATKQDATAIVQLKEYLDAEGAAMGDPSEFAHASATFHEKVAELAGNNTLAVFAEILEEIIDRHTTEVVRKEPSSPEDMEAAHKAHTRLYDLVAGGKATKAQAHWDEHMRAIGQWMLDGRESETLIELFE